MNTASLISTTEPSLLSEPEATQSVTDLSMSSTDTNSTPKPEPDTVSTSRAQLLDEIKKLPVWTDENGAKSVDVLLHLLDLSETETLPDNDRKLFRDTLRDMLKCETGEQFREIGFRAQTQFMQDHNITSIDALLDDIKGDETRSEPHAAESTTETAQLAGETTDLHQKLESLPSLSSDEVWKYTQTSRRYAKKPLSVIRDSADGQAIIIRQPVMAGDDGWDEKGV